MRKRSVSSIKPKPSEKANAIVGKCPKPLGLGNYSDDPKINLLCNICCRRAMPIVPNPSSNLELRPEFHDSLGRDVEKLDRRGGVAEHNQK
jgi:hypothetical protein